MRRLLFAVAGFALASLLSGCAIPEGIAHLAKMGMSDSSDKAAAPAANRDDRFHGTQQNDPTAPPPPKAAPRSTVRVESLPPR